MIRHCVLDVRAYISELMEKGKIDNFPMIQCRGMLSPLFVCDRNDHHFIAGRCHDRSAWRYESKWPAINSDSTFGINLACFPTNPAYAEIFSRSKVRPYGPQDDFPGSIAVLNGDYYPTSDQVQGALLYLRYLQYSFTQGSPPELTRSLASRYMGAGLHLLKYLFGLDDLISHVDRITIDGQLLSRKSTLETLVRILNDPSVLPGFVRQKGEDKILELFRK